MLFSPAIRGSVPVNPVRSVADRYQAGSTASLIELALDLNRVRRTSARAVLGLG
ncbi:hypothetical protein CAG70_06640 [Photobacterium halotolerans]|uniref:hypothetical protein n=1 Tax=Photobacterium halotolerans TaxID=265726 RepID=UPI00137372B1|nr:hypothetical protein [Photobacterium halotolerans]NAX46676.1 hypothetical protein [Photobacterium halotolerans]